MGVGTCSGEARALGLSTRPQLLPLWPLKATRNAGPASPNPSARPVGQHPVSQHPEIQAAPHAPARRSRRKRSTPPSWRRQQWWPDPVNKRESTHAKVTLDSRSTARNPELSGRSPGQRAEGSFGLGPQPGRERHPQTSARTKPGHGLCNEQDSPPWQPRWAGTTVPTSQGEASSPRGSDRSRPGQRALWPLTALRPSS